MRKKKSRRTYSPTSKRTGRYRSGFEAKVALQLENVGAAFSFESLRIEYTKPATYTPDFILPNGIIIEAKGIWYSEDRTKHLLVRKCHPDLDIRLCFQNPLLKIRKGSKTTYAAWCDKKGIKWCDKVIPKSWVSLKRTSNVPTVGVLTLDQ
jgi:hypothetical protein